MASDKTEEMKAKRTAYLVRAFEASCKIEHPTPLERQFRESLMKALGVEFSLREVRNVTFAATA